MDNKSRDTMFGRLGEKLTRSESNKTYVLNLQEILKASGLEISQIDPLIYDVFTNPDFVRSIPVEIRNNHIKIGAWLKNSNLFKSLIENGNSIFGEVISIPETQHADGRIRRSENGRQLLIEKIKELGVDTSCVLYFRRTQPNDSGGNPEHYWTSDYWETYSGLGAEIQGESRQSSVIFCSTLDDISSDSRLVVDINDDNGLSVRRETQSVYDQKRTLFVIKGKL